ncbi:MAG: 50S ribosomal protein L18 [Candidatus Magasanikbacteria bacterium CG10_big_fil_rev_8_21_14_0_10_43_6]|uniref:Large ribosomal subunit protein uL18 n=1 Tax=Candidatus Magasanikbacteria bacterium CG10_big_fil_rev_8_21_14_0_10_43_6 TaxID=1974650 RepID=A0A2M6W037_9BACT|nr:MAG: 50S ribosomal protein L18 [Candidatus Magasanikbacteria bacterium CG10_big_fil_rev_8_21_14_0_10_43_6]
MNKSKQTRQQKRERRHARIRATISGTALRPRLNVFRSLRGMNVQLIDDFAGKTLISVNSKTDAGNIADAGERKGKVAVAYLLGKTIGEKAKAAGITTVVFDRGGYGYLGRVKSVADGARDAGLTF